MANELLELSRMRADLPPADEAGMARARAALVRAATAPPARRHRSPARIAAMALAGAAAVATLVIVPTAGQHAPAASAVTMNDNGTVTVQMADLTSLASLAAANKVLTEAGIRAELVTFQSTCEPGSEFDFDSPVPDDDVLIPIPFEERMERIVSFRPDRIPADKTLVLLTIVNDKGFQGWWEVNIRPDGEIIPGGPSVPAHLIPTGAGTCYQYF